MLELVLYNNYTTIIVVFCNYLKVIQTYTNWSSHVHSTVQERSLSFSAMCLARISNTVMCLLVILNERSLKCMIVTCSEKRDNSAFSSILVWLDSLFCANVTVVRSFK